jgi:hypothetical protein
VRQHLWGRAGRALGAFLRGAVLAMLLGILATAIFASTAAIGFQRSVTYTYDTVAYGYDASALLSSQRAAALDVRGPPSMPEGASWVSPVSVRDDVVAADSAAAGADVAFGPAPENAWSTFDRVQAKGSPLQGYKGGSGFANDGRQGSHS